MVPTVVFAAVIIGMITIVPIAMADRDDDDDDDDDSWGNKKQLDNQVALMQRTDSVIIPPEKRFTNIYYCEKGEIMLGGMVENHFPESISSANWKVDHRDQSYDVNVPNRDGESITVTVTYLCASLKS